MKSQIKHKKGIQTSVLKLSKEKIETIEASLPFIPLVFVSLAVSLTTIVVAFLGRRYLPPEIPLLFGLPKGQDQLTSNSGIIIPSLFSLGFIITNSFLAYTFSDDFLKKTLIIISFAITVFATIATTEIFILVGSF